MASSSKQLPVRPDGRLGQERALELLHASLHVRERAFLLRERCGGQDDVGGARQRVGRPRADGEELRLPQDGDRLGVVGGAPKRARRRRRRPRARPCPEQHVRRARSRRAPATGPCPARRAGSRAASSPVIHPFCDFIRRGRADGRRRRRGCGSRVVGELAQQEVLLVREVRRAEEEDGRRRPSRSRAADRRGDAVDGRGDRRGRARSPPSRGASPSRRRAGSGSRRGSGRSRRASSR